MEFENEDQDSRKGDVVASGDEDEWARARREHEATRLGGGCGFMLGIVIFFITGIVGAYCFPTDEKERAQLLAFGTLAWFLAPIIGIVYANWSFNRKNSAQG
jgi:hypothetical protein